MAVPFQNLRGFRQRGIGEFRRRYWCNRSSLRRSFQHDLADADRVEMEIIQKAVFRQNHLQR